VLTNKKAEHRRGKVQLIDASQWFQSLRRNLGKKNCELADSDIERILAHYLMPLPADEESAKATPECKWFDNADYGYWKITVERPLRLKRQLKRSSIEALRFASGDDGLRAEIYAKYGDKLYEEFSKFKPEIEAWLKGDDSAEEPDDESDEDKPVSRVVPEKRRKKLLDIATWLRDRTLVELAQLAQQEMGDALFDDHNEFRTGFEAVMKAHSKKLGAADKKAIYKALSWRDETAPPVIAKRTKLKANEYFEPGYDGAYLARVEKESFMVEYEANTDLRDTEQAPLKEEGGIEAFFAREVLPHAPDAWIAMDATKIGYEISFARYFYKPTPLRTLEEIRADILKLEQKTEGLLHKIVGAV